MARARNLKPSFFLNTDLAKLEPLGRLLFAGLWCLADRSGRLEDNSLKIKAQLLPYDNADVDRLLTLLHNSKLIMRYRKRTDKCIQIINFEKHQYPHIKEPESTIPAPDKNSSVTVPIRLNPYTTESPIPILPKQLNPLSLIPESHAIFDLWNSMAAKSAGIYPVLKAMSKARAQKSAERLKQIQIEDWNKVMDKLLASSFLRGEVKDKNGKSWRATFDWLIDNDKNALKVLEGNYDDRNDSGNGAAYVPGKYDHLSEVRKEHQDPGQTK